VIKYRYNLETDPEPGPHVRRLRAWSPDLGGGKFTDTWVRVPCAKRGYRTTRVEMDSADRRSARRRGVSYVSTSGKRQHRPGTVLFVVSRRHCDAEFHYHWFDGDKYRPWGPLRGYTIAVDADAMRRLRGKKRRGWRRA
jgi:hypothetical protein